MTPAGSRALWLRAVRAADARGLLPADKARLTPAEVAAEAARRGEHRLARLVDEWYYPISYGRISGALSDEDARRLVASLEAELPPPPANRFPATEEPPPSRPKRCELCGTALR